MGIQVVQDDDNRLCLREKIIDQVAHTLSKVDLRATVRDSNVPPTEQGLEEQEEIGGAIPLVLVVKAFRLARLAWQWLARLGNELHDFLVKADLRALRIVSSGVHIQHILHAPDKLRPDRRDAPALSHPRLKPLFFNSLRTVSSEMLSTTFSSTKRSAKSCIVQRFRPSGGSLRASVSRIASPSHPASCVCALQVAVVR